MKKVKSIVIYAALAILCIISVYSYIQSKNQTARVLSNNSGEKSSSGPSQAVLDRMKKSTSIPSPTPVVGIGRGTDYKAVTTEAIENAGGIRDIVKKGNTVIIKPNLIRGEKAGSPVSTDYRMIQIIADLAKEAGASRIIVAEASPAGDVFKNAEYDKLQGVELLDMSVLNKEDCYFLKPDKSLTGQAIYIPKIYMDADVVITAAKLKTQYEAVVTLSLKNSIGVPPTALYGSFSGKMTLHSYGLVNTIVDLNKIRKPDFSVIDGIVGGDGNGPINVKPVNSNIIFAGVDPVALDTVALNFMGFTVDQVPHVQLAGNEGLGISDLSKITVKGADLNSIKMKFKPAVSY
ncbi:MAG: DUF362 domain-containing protein [Bacillota bacterium]|nr:DUF362 domain-containing protein [Bacillota bacterium]